MLTLKSREFRNERQSGWNDLETLVYQAGVIKQRGLL
jgi:hypothetical protein